MGCGRGCGPRHSVQWSCSETRYAAMTSGPDQPPPHPGTTLQSGPVKRWRPSVASVGPFGPRPSLRTRRLPDCDCLSSAWRGGMARHGLLPFAVDRGRAGQGRFRGGTRRRKRYAEPLIAARKCRPTRGPICLSKARNRHAKSSCTMLSTNPHQLMI